MIFSNRFFHLVATGVVALSLVVSTQTAEAKRLGGGKKMGQQTAVSPQGGKPSPSQAPQNGAGSPAQNSATAAPANKQATAAPAATGAAAGAAQAARKPWSGMLMGLAAGLGIAALASYLGFGEALAQFMTMVLVGLVLAVVVLWLVGRFRGSSARPAFAGAPSPFQQTERANHTSAPQGLSPLRRESVGLALPSGGALGHGSLARTTTSLDEVPFLAAAKRNFVALQAAWDLADHNSLRDLMTDELLANVEEQLSERGPAPNRTDVVTLEARFLGLDVVEGIQLASVEFSGMIREEDHGVAQPFREIWNMTKPLDGSRGWLVAGIQPLQ